jgi:hypothetical protein
MIAEARDPLGVSVNDEVLIRPAKVAGSQKTAFLMYGVPILLLFAGYAAGQAVARAWGLDSSKETTGVVAGLLGMALGLVGIYLASRRRRGGIGVLTVVEIIHNRAPLKPAGAVPLLDPGDRSSRQAEGVAARRGGGRGEKR